MHRSTLSSTFASYQHFLDISTDTLYLSLKKATWKQLSERKFLKLMQNVLTFTKIPAFFLSFFSFVLRYSIFFSKSANDDRSDNITLFLSEKMLLVYYPCQDIDFLANNTWWVRRETTSSFCFHNLTIWPDIWGYESASRTKEAFWRKA